MVSSRGGKEGRDRETEHGNHHLVVKPFDTYRVYRGKMEETGGPQQSEFGFEERSSRISEWKKAGISGFRP